MDKAEVVFISGDNGINRIYPPKEYRKQIIQDSLQYLRIPFILLGFLTLAVQSQSRRPPKSARSRTVSLILELNRKGW